MHYAPHALKKCFFWKKGKRFKAQHSKVHISNFKLFFIHTILLPFILDKITKYFSMF